jgi:hypothetical protein
VRRTPASAAALPIRAPGGNAQPMAATLAEAIRTRTWPGKAAGSFPARGFVALAAPAREAAGSGRAAVPSQGRHAPLPWPKGTKRFMAGPDDDAGIFEFAPARRKDLRSGVGWPRPKRAASMLCGFPREEKTVISDMRLGAMSCHTCSAADQPRLADTDRARQVRA